MKNTGWQYTVEWGYQLADEVLETCRLVKPAGDSFYSNAEAALLDPDEYRHAFDDTVKYMRDKLHWKSFPLPEECCVDNPKACPLGDEGINILPPSKSGSSEQTRKQF